jgi:hypothetical protein
MQFRGSELPGNQRMHGSGEAVRFKILDHSRRSVILVVRHFMAMLVKQWKSYQ